MMTEHLTENILVSLRARKIPPDDLVMVDDHLASCAACRESLGASFATASVTERFERVLVEQDHLNYGELESYVDGRMSADERAGVARHVETCTECGAELRELQDFAGVSTAVAPVSSAGWLSSLGVFLLRPVPVLASVVALVLAGGTIWFIIRGDDVADTPNTTDVVTTEPAAADVQPQISEPPANVPVEAPVPDLAVSINDGHETVGISKDGRLSGYASVRSNYRTLVAKALSEERLAIPDLGDLKTPAGVLMGNDSSPTGSFRVTSPVGKVIADDMPNFTWQAVPDAESYVVEVFDQDFNKVASSGEQKNSSWKRKLERGRTYSWQVTAVSDGKVFKAPQRPQPDARFRIIDARTANDLSALRRSHPRSHLLLGTAYANAGLIDEAIREFEILSRQNPRNDLPKQFLRQLRSAR